MLLEKTADERSQFVVFINTATRSLPKLVNLRFRMTDPTSSKTDSNLQSFFENQKGEIALKRAHQNLEFMSNEDSLSSVRNQDSQKTNKIKTKAAREKARREKLNER